MGLDIGTTGSKSVIFSEDGHVVAKAYREYTLYHREPHLSELNPEEVWAAIREVLRESIKRANVDSDRIEALSASVLGEAFVPVTKHGEPLYWSMTTFDARAVRQTRWWEENFGAEAMYEVTGQPLSGAIPIYTLPKIQWMRENEPETFSKTWKFLCWGGYLNLKLTGRAVTDRSVATRTMLFDIRRNEWAGDILGLAGLDEAVLPEVKPSGRVVGEVTREASRETGLAAGTLVVTGGHDQPSGALGAGMVEEGALMDSTGTVECYGAVQDRLVLDDGMRRQGFAVHSHVIEDKYFMFGFTPTGGAVLRWFRDNFGYEERMEAEKRGMDAYDILTLEASRATAPSLFLFPYFEGSGTPAWDRRARGALVGLTLSSTKGDVIRAILEGITFELRRNVEAIERYGIRLTEIRAVGGASRSPFWLQLKADVTGKEILAPEARMEAAALGVAILAAKGAGVHRDVHEAVRRMCRIAERYEPDAKAKGIYDEKYGNYLRLYSAVARMFGQR